MTAPKKSIFIGGTGRCGTSLLRKLISSDNRVVSLNFAIILFIEIDGVISTVKSLENHKTPYDENLILQRFSNLYFHLGNKKNKYLLDKYDYKQNIKKFNNPYKDWELAKHIYNYYKIFDKFIKELDIISYNGSYPRDESVNSRVNILK